MINAVVAVLIQRQKSQSLFFLCHMKSADLAREHFQGSQGQPSLLPVIKGLIREGGGMDKTPCCFHHYRHHSTVRQGHYLPAAHAS